MSGLNYDRVVDGRQGWAVEDSRFDPDHLAKYESIFALGNGYLGQRAALEERYAGETRGMFAAGTFDRSEPEEAPELPNLPDLTNVELTLSGCRFSLERGKLLKYARWLNLYTGELCREVEWESPGGQRFSLRFARFVSQKQLHLTGMRVEITPHGNGAQITVRTGINGQVSNTGAQHFRKGDLRLYPDGILEMSAPTGQSKIWCCLHASCRFQLAGAPAEPALRPVIQRRAIYGSAELFCPAESALVLEKLCCVHTQRDVEYAAFSGSVSVEALKHTGYALARGAAGQGYAALFQESADVWAAWWAKQDIRIDSREVYHQTAVRFALYHLNSMSSKRDARVGIPAKGLSGEGYLGHSFWDTEIFILPFFTFTCPQAARLLLEYRWHCLAGAREKARRHGYEGAMYPWESAWITDEEAAPMWDGADIITGQPMVVLTGLIEQHITADVSYAVWQYYSVTGDEDFMRRFGYEIIIDTARFWASRAQWDAVRNAFVIKDVIGPDEYKEHVDNNAYTNYMAHWNMGLALQLMGELPERDPETAAQLDVQFSFALSREKIRPVYDRLLLPAPGADGIIPQFDGYFALSPIDLTSYKRSKRVGTIFHDYNLQQLNTMQVSKQADVLMLLLLQDGLFDDGVKRRNYTFYEARTLHDSSLSKNTHCVLACDFGAAAEAEAFFEGSCGIDLGPEMASSDGGIHAAAMGGIWLCTVYGFGGVRMRDGQLCIAPRLHSQWRRLHFPLYWQGGRLEVTVSDKSVLVENKGEKAVSLWVSGSIVTILGGAGYEQEI